MLWYNWGYSGGEAVLLFSRVGTLFNSTFAAIYSNEDMNILAAYMTLILFGVVAGFLLYMIRNNKK